LNKVIQGKTAKPEALQFWQAFQVLKHLKV